MTTPAGTVGSSENVEALSSARLALHLDTTVMIDQCKARSISKPVLDKLSEFGFRSTSTYARYEFGRTWLRDLAYLYREAMTVERIEDLLGKINKSFRGGQLNRLTRCIEAVEAFLGRLPNSLPYGLALVRFREAIAHALLNAQTEWDRKVHHHFSGTGCARAEERPRRAPNEKIIFTLNQCRRNKIVCRIHQFHIENAESFMKIAKAADDAGASASEQLLETARTIRSVMDDPESLCDDRKCATLGDALIAVDGIKVPTFGANNDAEWKPIANALGKNLFNPRR